jgi:hypothetical protein
MELENEIETDYLAAIQTYGGALSELLEVPPPSYETLTVRTIDQADFVDGLARGHAMSASEIALVRKLVARNERFYLPSAAIAYLASPSQNGAAELAAAHLQRTRTRSHAIFPRGVDEFYLLVLEAAFDFFGSLMINPRRKCDFPADHARRLRALRAASGAAVGEARARELAVALLACERRLATGRPARVPDVSTWVGARAGVERWLVARDAARFSGRMLAKRMQHAFLEGSLAADTVKRLCLARVDGEHRPFQERWEELILAVARAELVPSKRDVL